MDRRHQMTRYARQIALAEIGAAGQRILSESTVLVVGAGGLGSPVLQYLAGAGVGRIRIVDPDLVELSNLHRQPLFVENDVGQAKTQAAAHRIGCMNPELRIEQVIGPLNPANVHAMLAGIDLALDCADNFAVGYTLSDACQEVGVPLIAASALGFSGYVGGFCAGAPSLRALFPELPERAANCATGGISGPVVGLLGSCQAQMAMSVLLKLEPSPLGKLLRFDGQSFRFSEFDFRQAREPAGRRFAFMSLAGVAAEDFFAELRTVKEAPEPAVRHAVRLDGGSFDRAGPRPGPGQRAVFCCRTGLRAWKAARRLREVWDGDIRLVAIANEEEGIKTR